MPNRFFGSLGEQIVHLADLVVERLGFVLGLENAQDTWLIVLQGWQIHRSAA
ncbi:MAG: hypothetical protein HY000_14980 [Planctomycetes bacterium]|nr:hypothetical protein [Planctomycetota bacterium]